MWSSIRSCLWDFEPTETAELTAAADRDLDDHAARLHAIVLACGDINTGRLDAADAAIAILRQLLARRGLPFAHHTAEVTATNIPASLEGPALNVHWARAVVDGRFDDAIPLLRSPTSAARRDQPGGATS
jgi:hypothetical protein